MIVRSAVVVGETATAEECQKTFDAYQADEKRKIEEIRSLADNVEEDSSADSPLPRGQQLWNA